MKNAVLSLILLAATILISTNALSQELDTLYLSSVYAEPGDTAAVVVNLRNQSFRVGAISCKIYLPDSTEANFVGIEQGLDILDFGMFDSYYSDGYVRILGIANMPEADPISPLPIGFHELAILHVAIFDSTEAGTEIAVIFDRSHELANMISDSSGYSLAEPFTVDGTIAVDYPYAIDGGVDPPTDFIGVANYPNPFNMNTIIEFTLTNPGMVVLDIFDIQGRRVNRLWNGETQAGHYQIDWQGKSEKGVSMPSGVYFMRLESGIQTINHKMILLK